MQGKFIRGGFTLALFVALATGAATAQDQSAATAKDVIFARKILMDTIGKNMDALEGFFESDKLEPSEVREHSENISVMLMSFPHLFPPASNQWKEGAERDPGLDTFASPDVWKNFSDFYKRADAASKIGRAHV